MGDNKNKFEVGDLVVLKTHPLLETFRIKGDSIYVPPIMMIKEVFIENKSKKIIEEETGNRVADRVKYTCCYFNNSKSEFTEAIVYETMIDSFENLKIERIDNKYDIHKDSKTIIKEINSYKPLEYEYGKKVRFKTKKIEIYKKRSSKKFPIKSDGEIDKENVKEIVQYVVNYSSPDFLLSGVKNNDITDLYYSENKPKRLVSKRLYKIKWFNPVLHKFSEQYLPSEFLTDEMKFD